MRDAPPEEEFVAQMEKQPHDQGTQKDPSATLLHTLEHLLQIDVNERQTALTQMSQLVHQAFGADKVDIMFFQEDINSLVALGTSDTPLGRKERMLGLDRLPLANDGREVEVFSTGRPHLTGHADQDPHEVPGLVEALGIRSSMVVPLEVDGVRRGVMLASSTTPERFGQRELELFGAVARWVGVVVHHAELVERNREQAREQGRRMAADELVTVVAHDLRNYLTPLKARIDLMLRRARRRGSTHDIEDAEVASREIDRLSRLIGNVLDASRIEQGLFALDPQPMDLVAMLHDLADALMVPRTRIRLRLPDGLDELIIIADPDRVRQALENLLANALHYAPQRTEITLELELVAPETQAETQAETRAQEQLPEPLARRLQWAVIAVRDRGPGISPEVASRIFTRFASGTNSPGLGLGLYLVREIALAHGGDLTVDATSGEGTRFVLRLPVEGLQEAATQTPEM